MSFELFTKYLQLAPVIIENGSMLHRLAAHAHSLIMTSSVMPCFDISSNVIKIEVHFKI